MKRAVYDKQFKMAAVKHAQSVKPSVSEAAKTSGISVGTLRRWINEYEQYGERYIKKLQVFLKQKNS
ncbi:MAG: transposase [Clostridiales bacterium]|nr:transposase [Clostridiales bacterium]